MRSLKQVRYTLSLIAVIFVCGTISAAHALPVACISASGLPCIANSGDVLAGGLVVPNSGNDSEALVEAAIESATSSAVDIMLYGKSDENPTLFTFSGFDIGTSLVTSKSGNWSVIDLTAIAYISIKTANAFAVYSAGGLSSGTYDTEGMLNNGGQQPTVSHISFWKTNPETEVPEPMSMLLLGSALVGLGAVKSRKKS